MRWRNVPMGDGNKSPAIQSGPSGSRLDIRRKCCTDHGSDKQVQTLEPTASDIPDIATVIVTDRDILDSVYAAGGLPLFVGELW